MTPETRTVFPAPRIPLSQRIGICGTSSVLQATYLGCFNNQAPHFGVSSLILRILSWFCMLSAPANHCLILDHWRSASTVSACGSLKFRMRLFSYSRIAGALFWFSTISLYSCRSWESCFHCGKVAFHVLVKVCPNICIGMLRARKISIWICKMSAQILARTRCFCGFSDSQEEPASPNVMDSPIAL